MAAIPIETAIVDPAEAPIYLRIGEKARHLPELGMSDRAIARALGVSNKTVTKSIARQTLAARVGAEDRDAQV